MNNVPTRAHYSDDTTVKIGDFEQCQQEQTLTGHGWNVKSVDWLLFPLLIFYLLFNLSCAAEAEDEKNVTNIGAIIDVNSRICKEQKAAMEIAAENFNKQSDTHELILHFRDSGRDPFLAAYAAKHLIKEQKVQVIIGMDTWQEAITADVVHNQPEKFWSFPLQHQP